VFTGSICQLQFHLHFYTTLWISHLLETCRIHTCRKIEHKSTPKNFRAVECWLNWLRVYVWPFSIQHRLRMCQFHKPFGPKHKWADANSFMQSVLQTKLKTSLQVHTTRSYALLLCSTLTNVYTRGQFHQHYSSSFYVQRSQKLKKKLMTWLNFHAFGSCTRKSCL